MKFSYSYSLGTTCSDYNDTMVHKAVESASGRMSGKVESFLPWFVLQAHSSRQQLAPAEQHDFFSEARPPGIPKGHERRHSLRAKKERRESEGERNAKTAKANRQLSPCANIGRNTTKHTPTHTLVVFARQLIRAHTHTFLHTPSSVRKSLSSRRVSSWSVNDFHSIG